MIYKNKNAIKYNNIKFKILIVILSLITFLVDSKEIFLIEKYIQKSLKNF